MQHRLWQTIVLLFIVLASCTGIASAGIVRTDCEKKWAAALRELQEWRQRLDEVHRKLTMGTLTERVSALNCTLRVMRIGRGIFSQANSKDFRETVGALNDLHCTELKIFELDQMCFCAERGLTFSEAGYDTMMYLKRHSDTIQNVAIPNSFIKAWVDKADEAKTCFDQKTLQTLQNLSTRLEGLDLLGAAWHPSLEITPPARSATPSSRSAPQNPTHSRPSIIAPNDEDIDSLLAPFRNALPERPISPSSRLPGEPPPIHVIPPPNSSTRVPSHNDPRSNQSTVTGPIRPDNLQGGGTAPTNKISRPEFLGGGKPGGVSIGTQKLEITPQPELAPMIDEAKRLLEKQR
jgi:hypothetical protein